MPENHLLVCADADSPMMIEGATFDKCCRRCGRRLMVAPSGKRFLALYPKAETECMACHMRDPLTLRPGEPITWLLERTARVVPNLRRSRN
jgi:hypothetical protein